jgi:hypothetical protein
VIAKLLEEKEANKQTIKELATILKIPRLHLDYIKKNGVDTFVEKCKEVVYHHDMIEEE